ARRVNENNAHRRGQAALPATGRECAYPPDIKSDPGSGCRLKSGL
ncbi:MAG: hypothetical protein, partial [Olavius algarvensis Delta 4 endosymbiont]